VGTVSGGEAPRTVQDAPLSLTPTSVHLYCADLDLPQALVWDLEGLLSPDEHKRAESFAYDYLRRRYIAGRGQLRLLLGNYLQTAPAQVEFAYGPAGKPRLADPDAANRLAFNVAHSQDVALLAITRGPRVGTDIEQVRDTAELSLVASRYFSHLEQTTLFALPHAEQVEAFYRIWTRKEAFLKASGEGLWRPLDSFSVSLGRDDAQLLDLRDAAFTPTQWQFVHLEPAPGYCGALVCEGFEPAGGQAHWPVVAASAIILPCYVNAYAEQLVVRLWRL
jgi:4'-phosphopantetheinyl transferase